MNKIFIENFTLWAKHGYYKEEHFKKQRFVVSMWCEVKENKSGKEDDLGLTLNYEFLRKNIEEVILGEGKKLLEKLAEDILGKIMLHPLVLSWKSKLPNPTFGATASRGCKLKK
jgi:dihydroneopterin aldolase/2-amino-4-hydroxy-6-hydroxymethyldihydropteridine diphosphokinase